jgi:hypothetical protein
LNGTDILGARRRSPSRFPAPPPAVTCPRAPGPATMAATNKCLAQSNKSPHRANATNDRQSSRQPKTTTMTRLLLCTALVLTLVASPTFACPLYTCDDPRSVNYEGRLLEEALAGLPKAPLGTCVVNDPTDTPLNVRSRPYGKILGALRNGTFVNAGKRNGKWIKIVPEEGRGKSGWVFRQYLQCKLDDGR